ncbi:hypothetical protein BDN72DRAFT_444187 [Pluteus cervinus]|uniref:Uncharacterized protein n=1 Tax=Pluteus cervinus TaxID=181527 RepID=A0ACD3BD28_9AGAR|nr:hypothetical protein BDN72DRAFT_444187 [Pluteus cervinus]
MVGGFRFDGPHEDIENVPLISSGELASSREEFTNPRLSDDRNDHGDQSDRRIGSSNSRAGRGLRPWSTFIGSLPWARTQNRALPNGRGPGIFGFPRNDSMSSERRHTSSRPSCSWLFSTLVLIAFLTSTTNLFLSATRLASPISQTPFRTVTTTASNPGRGLVLTRQEIDGLRNPSSYVGLDRVPEIKQRLSLAGNTSTGASSHSLTGSSATQLAPAASKHTHTATRRLTTYDPYPCSNSIIDACAYKDDPMWINCPRSSDPS